MESQRKRLKPRLERRNAMKNIDYQVPPFDDTYSASSVNLSPYLHNQTSFRMKGIDGEFDHIFRILGLSGPEDFAIPTAAWEQAQKARFASSPFAVVATRPRLHAINNNVEEHLVPGPAKLESGVGLNGDIELKNQNFQQLVAVVEGKEKVNISSKVLGENRDGGGGGIKGVRPPVLAPPPVKLRPLLDEVTSTWDLMRSFAPQDDDDDDDALVHSPILGEEENEKGIVEENEERNLLSDSNSSTSHDDDSDVGGETEKASFCMVDESIHNVSPNGSFRRTFSSWQKGEILGKGSFGTVYEGFTDDGIFFAVKEVSLLDEGSQGKQSILQLQQEISLLSQFEHENIVRYLGTDKDNNMLYIFLELVTKGSLSSLYQKYSLRDSQVSAYTRQILSGLKYLHDRNVVHRDIKCANILVDANGSVKLADFGLAKATKLNDVKSSKGSPYWMAPEVVNLRNRGYGLAADIWSLGCTVLEMLTRQPPYSHLEGMQALFRIGRGQPPPVPESLSKDARDFILKCLQVIPNKRPTATQLLDHPFVKRPLLSPISHVSPRINLLLS